MAENIKAAGYAANLSASENKKIDDFYKSLEAHKTLSNMPQDLAAKKYSQYTPEQQANLVKNFGNEDPLAKKAPGSSIDNLYMRDPMQNLTKKGKMNKLDVDRLKMRIRKNLAGINTEETDS